jgi:hydroxyacyl-ACP dehydratase HTD2-like protein with hotdog domain
MALRPDGSDPDFCPPTPFTRRLWASGSMVWHSPLIIGEEVQALSTVTSVEKKGFEKGSPMVFVNQTIEYTRPGHHVPSVVEERTHVYLPPGLNKRSIREGTQYIAGLFFFLTDIGTVKDLPSRSDFEFTYTPNATTLFRFSALTFNGHRIHLDKDYAQQVEGYPGSSYLMLFFVNFHQDRIAERLVHGPLTALMLLETVKWHYPSMILTSFQYRARNPVVVDEQVTIRGVWVDETSIEMWTTDSCGVVGMTGRITIAT